MSLKNYKLTEVQKQRLVNGVRATLSIPLIDSLEDFIWEGLFCYVKQVDFVDPFLGIRSKKLFDVVDTNNNIGWSAKTVQWNFKEGGEFEVVIQRADIFKKRESLGFPELNMNSEPDLIGSALLKHWEDKIIGDALSQKVTDRRVCILIKNIDNKKFAYFEEDFAIYKLDNIIWNWTNNTKTGLQGIRKEDGFCVYRWYPNQKQFFERFKFGNGNFSFEIEPKRIGLNEIIDLLNRKI